MSAPSSSGSVMRVSQRQPQSCIECTRRKTKCDKRVPCCNCLKRGVPEKCRLEQVLPSKSLRTLSGIKKFREETNASQAQLEARIKDLEAIIRRAHPAPDTLSTSPDIPISSSIPFSASSLTGLEPSSFTSSTGFVSPEPGEDELVEMDAVGDDEAEAAGTLEFLALGRTRGKSPGGDGGEIIEMDGIHDGKEEEWIAPEWLAKAVEHSPFYDTGRYLSDPSRRATGSRHQPSQENRRDQLRQEIIGKLPDKEVSRKLVQYDIENVAWLHCCYHGVIFLSECDLFWSEMDSSDVEENWSFVALLFAVLASAVHHLPAATFSILFPGSASKAVVSRLFSGSLAALHQANWMHSHSLYAVQAVAILVSPANHLDKADLYFTMLGTAIRIAQALNLHRLGPDSTPKSHPEEYRISIAREVRKRTWYQLVIQDWFHVAFNGTNSIHASQFNTPLPRHIRDDDKVASTLPADQPSSDLHIIHLSKVAAVVNKMYSASWGFKPVSYDRVLQADAEMQHVISAAPAWMTDDTVRLDRHWPIWVQWQRYSFMISAAHKVIILHRPYLGRAFSGDGRYIASRTACLQQANRILHLFHQCTLDAFRKTWTVVAHVIAAALVILIEAVHNVHAETNGLLRPVQTALAIFEDYAPCSDLAKKGIVVLRSLIRTVESPSSSDSSDDQFTRDFAGSAGKDLKRAVDILKRKRGVPVASASASSSSQLHQSETLSPVDGIIPLWGTDVAMSDIDMADLGNLDDIGNGLDSALSDDLFDTLFGLNNDGGPWDAR